MEYTSFLTVCLSPALQKTLVIPGFYKNTVNRTSEYSFDIAGKGINTSRVLIQLGKTCRHLTCLGGTLRPLFLELSGRDNIDVEWVDSNSSIRFCYTLIEKDEKAVTEIVEEAEKVGEGTEERLLEAFSNLIKKSKTIIISGSKAAGFSSGLIPEMVMLAKKEGCRVILDVRGPDLLNSLPFFPDIIKPNLFEFISTFAPGLVSQNSIRLKREEIKKETAKIWAGLYEKFSSALVLTSGVEPVWYSDNGDLSEYAITSVEPLNTTGSGDAFTAGLASAIEEGAALREAVAEGARCGALNAGFLRPGVIK